MEISTPGRICLFGEHQDYLGLPVISMAISLRVTISGQKRRDRKIIIHKPDIGETETFSLDNLGYSHKRDYFWIVNRQVCIWQTNRDVVGTESWNL